MFMCHSLRLHSAATRQMRELRLALPRLRTVQIHVALVSGLQKMTSRLRLFQCHLHLGMSRFKEAWLAFGTAARLSQLLRLHRKSADGTPVEIDGPRRLAFWCAFMMDRYGPV